VHPVVFLIDDTSTLADLIQFQQMIFLQDRIILEDRRSRLLPLEPRTEVPTRADASSVACCRRRAWRLRRSCSENCFHTHFTRSVVQRSDCDRLG
jgi:hypothetical protein